MGGAHVVRGRRAHQQLDRGRVFLALMLVAHREARSRSNGVLFYV